jgi:hypothetical protein
MEDPLDSVMKNISDTENNVGNEAIEYKINPIFDALAVKYGSEESPFNLPDEIKTGKVGAEAIKPEYIFDFIEKTILERNKPVEIENHFVKSYLEASSNQGFDHDEFIASQAEVVSMKNKSDFDFMFEVMKKENGKSDNNPEGFTEDEIKEYLESQGRVALNRERKALESQLTEKRNLEQSQLMQQKKEALKQELKLLELKEAPILDQLSKKYVENRVINGIEFGESDMKNAAEEFKLLNKYSEDGTKPIVDMIFTPDNLFKAFMFLRRDGALIREILSTLKSDQAKIILERTGIEPREPNATFGVSQGVAPTMHTFLE